MKILVLHNIMTLLILTIIGIQAKELPTQQQANILLKDHPIYSKIVELKPSINKSYAMYLSNLLHKYAKRYNQDPFISVAIAMQENQFRNTHRKQQIVVFEKDHYKLFRGYTDICVYQIHLNTALNYNIDLVKLNKSLEYCVEQHFRILTDKKRMCKHLAKDAWTCYHSNTGVNRLHYKKLVERYL